MVARELTGGGAALVAAGVLVYFWFLRDWRLHWGATPAEAAGRGPPATSLMPEPDIMATRVVEIDTPPSAIWPSLVQMGPGRGGAYTYHEPDRASATASTSTTATASSPSSSTCRWAMRSRYQGYAMRVDEFDPGQAMVARSSNHAWVW